MTGIQVLKTIAPDLAMKPGKPLAREFEYERLGTQTLIAAMNVTTGVVHAQCGDTRTEADFCDFIKILVEKILITGFIISFAISSIYINQKV